MRFHGLYVNGFGPDGTGLYYLPDNDPRDHYYTVEFLKQLPGPKANTAAMPSSSEPDKKLYIVSGNFTQVPKDISPDSPHRNFAEDQLLPRDNDGNGFGNSVKPPGGFLLRTDADGKKWRLCSPPGCATHTTSPSTRRAR